MRSLALAGVLVIAVGGCAQMDNARDADVDSPKLKQARESYVQCVTAEAEKDAGSPAGAEDIALAAHGRCWSAWDAYRQATNRTFADGATSRDERQLAHDKADAHLRQFELETRRSVVSRIVERTLGKKP